MFALGGDASERVRSSAKFLSKASWRVNPRSGTARPVRFRREAEKDWAPRERLAVARPELAFLKRQSLTLEFSFDCRIHRRFRNDDAELPPDVSQ